MSQYVAIESSKLPSVAEWNQAANEIGFTVEIEDAVLSEHSGYLPVKFLGCNSGFEFYLDRSSSIEEFGLDKSKFDSVVEFVTFSDENEAQCALVCAIAMLKLTNGVYYDSEGGHCEDPFVLYQQARDWIDS